LQFFFVRIFEHNELVNANKPDVDIEKDGDKSKPIEVLSVVGDKVILIPLLEVVLIHPSQRALDLTFENECNCAEYVPIKREDFNNKPSVDPRELILRDGVHLEVLCIENGALVLKY
jgi:hypothetical protein